MAIPRDECQPHHNCRQHAYLYFFTLTIAFIWRTGPVGPGVFLELKNCRFPDFVFCPSFRAISCCVFSIDQDTTSIRATIFDKRSRPRRHRAIIASLRFLPSPAVSSIIRAIYWKPTDACCSRPTADFNHGPLNLHSLCLTDQHEKTLSLERTTGWIVHSPGSETTELI